MRRSPLFRSLTAMVATSVLASLTLAASPSPQAPPGAGSYGFPVTATPILVTNEFAYWNPDDTARVASDTWEMTSGSLFAVDGLGWTGVPDATTPDAVSSNGTGSSVFRLNTIRRDLGDVSVSFLLQNLGYSSTDRTPAVDWDGVNVWIRYQDEFDLYAVHVNRRDGTTKIERKVPGGEANNGTYHTIATGTMALIPSQTDWQAISVEVVNVAQGVRITAWQNGTEIASGIDNGNYGTPPITAPGAVGIRGDNVQFMFDAFSVVPSAP